MSTQAPTSSARRAGRGGAAQARPPRRAGHPVPAARSGPPRHDGLDRLRVLLAGTMGAILAGYTIMVPMAAVLTATGDQGVSADGALATAIPLWLAAQQIPLVLDGQPLGVLPLLPTIAVFAVVMLASGWSVRRLGGRVRHDAGAVVASQAGAAAAVAVLGGALLPREMAVTAPWASMVGAGLVAGAAAGVGVLRACGPPAAWRDRLQGWPAAGLAGARVGAAGLLLGGTLVLLAGLVGHAGEVAHSFATLAPGAGAGLGVALLALVYLPNVLLAGVAWSLGPGIAVGPVQSGPFGAVAGPLPPFPLFAAIPVGPVPAWAVLVLLLPLGAGAGAGVICARSLGSEAPRTDRLAAAGLAAGLAAAGAGLAAAVAGGRLAAGPYDPVSLSGWPVFLAALVLVGVPAVAVCVGLDRSTTAAGRAAGATGRTAGGTGGSGGRSSGPRVRPGRSPGDTSARHGRRSGAARSGEGGRARAVDDEGRPAERRSGRAARPGPSGGSQARAGRPADGGESRDPGRRRGAGRAADGRSGDSAGTSGCTRGDGGSAALPARSTKRARPREGTAGTRTAGSDTAATPARDGPDGDAERDVTDHSRAATADTGNAATATPDVDPPRTVAELVARRERAPAEDV